MCIYVGTVRCLYTYIIIIVYSHIDTDKGWQLIGNNEMCI